MISIFVSLVLIGLFILLYLKERKIPGHTAPAVFRVIIILFLVLIAIAHIFRFSYTRSAKIPVMVLVDASKSIKVGNNLDQIKQIIDKIKQEPFRKKFYSFSDTISSLENYEQALGERTDIGEAVSFAKDKRPGAIVLITDGQHNAKNDPFSIAQNIQAPIYTIGIGSEQKPDIAIQSIRRPFRCFLGDTIEIVARVFNKGFENYQTQLKLELKGKTLRASDVVFVSDNALQDITFKIVPDTIGKATYTVRMDTLADEATKVNNRKDFSIEVLKNRWQIIYLTNSPSFNSRFIISNLTNRDNSNFHSTSSFSVIPMIALVGKNIEMPKDISASRALANADVVILDDINELTLSSEVITNLNNFAEQGKGILLLTGENFRPSTFVSKISPVEFTNSTYNKTDIFIELTETGATTPIFFNETGQYLLDNTPPLLGQSTKYQIKSDASIWAMAKDNKTPLISFGKYKNSKVVLMSGFPIWRLGFSSVQTEPTRLKFEQFLKNLVRFLAIKDFEQFRLLTDKPDYLTGEDIIFNLIATTPDGRNWTGLDVNVNLPKEKISIPMYEISPGIYECNANALTPGDYEVNAVINKNNKQIGTAKTNYSVTGQSIEDFIGLNSDLLIKLSRKNEGKYYTPTQFLNETFLPKIIKYRKTISFTFHNNWYIYVIVTVLFGITLLLRKKRGFL